MVGLKRACERWLLRPVFSAGPAGRDWTGEQQPQGVDYLAKPLLLKIAESALCGQVLIQVMRKMSGDAVPWMGADILLHVLPIP